MNTELTETQTEKKARGRPRKPVDSTNQAEKRPKGRPKTNTEESRREYLRQYYLNHQEDLARRAQVRYYINKTKEVDTN